MVFGARRHRASQLARKEAIPALVREVSDAEVLEAQLIELSTVVKRFFSAFAVLHVVEMSTTCKFRAYRDHYAPSKQPHAGRSHSRGGAFCPAHLVELAITVEDRLEECVSLKSSIQT